MEHNIQQPEITAESINANLPIIENDPLNICDWWMNKAEENQARDNYEHDKNVIWFRCKDLLYMINTEISKYKIPLSVTSEQYTPEEIEILKNLPLDPVVDMVFDREKVNEGIKALHIQYPKSLYWKVAGALGITILFTLYEPYSKEFYEKVKERKPYIIRALESLKQT